MKKLGLVIAAFAISSCAMAQKDTNRNNPYPSDINKSEEGRNRKSNINQYANDNPDSMRNSIQRRTQPDGYMMQNGRMVGFTNDKMTPMEKNITLSNGTVINSGGYLTKKDGTKITQREGDQLDMMGNTIPRK